MRIAVIALGTRGDVQPLLALAKGLQSANHDVVMVAGRNFESWVRSHGIELVPTVDTEALMATDSGKAWSEGGDNAMVQLRQMRVLLRQYADEMFDSIHDAGKAADLLLSGFVSDPFAHVVSQKYSIPQISAALQPYNPTASGAASIQPLLPRQHSILNHWMGIFVKRLLWTVYGEPQNLMRAKIGLPSLAFRAYNRALAAVPMVNGYSQQVVPTPPDWENHVYTAGYWFLDGDVNWHPPDDLMNFLAAGEKPIYLGFGSMSSTRPEATLKLIVDALTQTQQRGVVVSGWSGITQADLPSSVYLLQSAPHSWLFPQMSAVIHHGGAGTTAAGLRAGVPTMIIPHLGDQPYWGRRVYELGVGVKPIIRPKLTVEGLVAGIRTMTTDSAIRAKAADLGARIRAEDGIATAIEQIEHIMASR